MGYHDFQYHETFNVAGVELGQSWAEFVENSQTYQARLLKYALEHYRRAKYEALGGMFQFMFMDCWPSITWSVVGYNRVPKKGYHVLQQCYQPILIGLPQSGYAREKVQVGPPNLGSRRRPLWLLPWVVNDTHSLLENCTYSVSLKGAGTPLEFTCDEPFDIPPDSMALHAPGMTVPIPDDALPGEYQVVITLKQGQEILSVNSYPLELVVVE